MTKPNHTTTEGDRPHDRQLIPKLTKLYDSNFIVRMLHKQVYWHSLLTFFIIRCSFRCLLYSACLSLYMMSPVIVIINKRTRMNMNKMPLWCFKEPLGIAGASFYRPDALPVNQPCQSTGATADCQQWHYSLYFYARSLHAVVRG